MWRMIMCLLAQKQPDYMRLQACSILIEAISSSITLYVRINTCLVQLKGPDVISREEPKIIIVTQSVIQQVALSPHVLLSQTKIAT